MQDILIVTTGFATFVFFLATHFTLFRFLRPEQLFKGIMAVFAAGLFFGAGAACFIFNEGTLMYRAVLILLALTIYTLAAFVYVLCVFGPYETSIRMRLVRELYRFPDGVEPQGLLRRYNTAVILDNRLQRLLGSGDLVRDGQRFHVRTKFNVFFVIDAVAQKLYAFIHAG